MDTYQVKGMITIFFLLFMMIFSSANYASKVNPNPKAPSPNSVENTAAGCMACHQGETIKLSKK